MNTQTTPLLPLQEETPNTVNPTTKNGENPHQIGDSIASEPKKRNRTRSYLPQEERLLKLVETLKTTEYPNTPETIELLQILTQELGQPTSKKRLKLIYKAEEKLQEWGIYSKENTSLETSKINLDTKTQLIATAKNIETKLTFCKSQGIKLKNATRYAKLQEHALKATKLSQEKRKKAYQKLLKEAQQTEKAILEECEEHILKKKNPQKRTLSERWFLFKLKLLVFLLFPNNQWEEAAKILEQASENNCSSETKKTMKLCVHKIQPKQNNKIS